MAGLQGVTGLSIDQSGAASAGGTASGALFQSSPTPNPTTSNTTTQEAAPHAPLPKEQPLSTSRLGAPDPNAPEFPVNPAPLPASAPTPKPFEPVVPTTIDSRTLGNAYANPAQPSPA